MGTDENRNAKETERNIPVPTSVIGKTFNWVQTDPSPDTFQNYFQMISSGRKIAFYCLMPLVPFVFVWILMAKYQMKKNKQFVRFDLTEDCVELKTWLLEGRS